MDPLMFSLHQVMLSFGSAPVSNCARGNSSKLPDYLPEEDDDIPVTVISDKVSQFFSNAPITTKQKLQQQGPTPSVNISNKMAIAKHKKIMIECPISTFYIISYVPHSEHYFVAQQLNKKILRASCLWGDPAPWLIIWAGSLTSSQNFCYVEQMQPAYQGLGYLI